MVVFVEEAVYWEEVRRKDILRFWGEKIKDREISADKFMQLFLLDWNQKYLRCWVKITVCSLRKGIVISDLVLYTII